MSTWTERQFGSETEAVEFNLNYPFLADEGQLGAPKTWAGQFKAHLRAAATFRFKSSGRKISLFDQLKARSISAGDQGDEEAARKITAIGHRDRAAGATDSCFAEVGRIGRAAENCRAAVPLHFCGEGGAVVGAGADLGDIEARFGLGSEIRLDRAGFVGSKRRAVAIACPMLKSFDPLPDISRENCTGPSPVFRSCMVVLRMPSLTDCSPNSIAFGFKA